jgi:2-polyprenyl-3-methyl-5-hydroxy-6-metoxy-1,4-benzoquinol methylase
MSRASMDRDEWNARYAAQDLLWGAEPNRFVAAELGGLAPRGRALDVACGEGRNAIWLARLGWRVTAVDYSAVAIGRARRLAAQHGVDVEWIEADVTAFVPEPGAFHLVVVAYLHLPGAERRQVLAHAAAALAPGGTLLMIGHARRNLAEGVGGPQRPEVLWDADEVRREVEALGLRVARAEDVLRPVETPQGVRNAVDALVRAERAE